MPSRRTVVVIGLAFAGVACLAFFLGRTTAPSKLHDVQVSATSDSKSDMKTDSQAERTASQQSTASSVATDQGSEWTEHTTFRPDGSIRSTRKTFKKADSRTETAEKKASQEVAKATAHAEAHAEAHTEYVYKDRLVEAARPNWSLGAHAGLGLDLKPRYGAELGRRVGGGLWLGVAVDVPTRAGEVVARLEF
jgi:hypothetical protein